MNLLGIVVEIRRNIHCANIFLKFEAVEKEYLKRNQANDSTADCQTFKISVAENIVKIKDSTNEVRFKIDDNLIVDAGSLSNLIVEENNASFRLTVQPKDDKSYHHNNFLVNDFTYSSAILKSKLSISTADNFNIICRCCHVNFFDKPKIFNRILEFPSGSIDINEFFCHNGPNFESTLIPKASDLFYGFYFIILNCINLTNFRIKCEHIYCKRCLSYIGESIFSEKAVKIWNDNIKITKTNENASSLFKYSNNNSIIYDLINKILSECNINEEVHCLQFAKIIIEAYFPNRTKKYLMLNILEKNLEILHCSNAGLIKTEQSPNIKLNKLRGIKALYKIEEDENSAQLSFWKNDFTVHSTLVSHNLFTALENTLNERSTLLPVIYRRSNDFILSYLFFS